MNSSDSVIALTSLLIPLCGILLPVAIVAIVMYSRNVNTRQRHETISRMIEKGLPIPPELLVPQHDMLATRSTPPSTLKTALTLIGLGIGLIIFFLVKGGDNFGFGAIGAIPLAIGLAQLLAWRLERPKAGAADSNTTE